MSGSQHIASIDELLTSLAAVVSKETSDRVLLAPLANPTPGAWRSQLFDWAAAGFPIVHIVQSFAIIPPTRCSDGVSRDPVGYINYLLGSDLDIVVPNIQSMMTGIAVAYSYADDKLRIHVSRMDK